VSDWKIDNHIFQLKIVVPPNTSATVYVPTSAEQSVREGGIPVHKSKGVTFLGAEDGAAKCLVVSGSYEFRAEF
jgi:alpha-L-rhamnosidase